MNTATKNLENDHVHILRLIDVMEKMILQNSTSTKHFDEAVSLIKSYADGFHHAKEENLLFPMMVRKGYSPEQGPIAVMINEHIQGRNFVKGINEGITAYSKGDKSALTKIYDNMHGYIVLLRNHIAKENNILFRMADNVLSEMEHEKLLKEFDVIEKKGVCGGQLSDCINAIDKLESYYQE